MGVHSILVYTDGEVIGDGMLRLTFAQALKAAAPEAKLTWLSSGYSVYDTTLKALAAPLIDELIILPDRQMKLSEYLLGPKALRGRTFDLIIDTQRNVKRSLWLSRIHHRAFSSAAGKGLFATRKRAEPFSPHFLERLMELGSLGLGESLSAHPLPLPAGDWEKEAAALLPDGTRYVGFITGAGHPDKCWSLDKFMALAQQVSTQGYTPVMFLGPQETAHRETLHAALPNAIFPLNGTANPTPYLTIALGARLTVAVANDSGGGHLLAAANTPLVSLFRSATVRTKFMPNGTNVTALAPEDFGVEKMQDIPLEAVGEALQKFLQTAPSQ